MVRQRRGGPSATLGYGPSTGLDNIVREQWRKRVGRCILFRKLFSTHQSDCDKPRRGARRTASTGLESPRGVGRREADGAGPGKGPSKQAGRAAPHAFIPPAPAARGRWMCVAQPRVRFRVHTADPKRPQQARPGTRLSLLPIQTLERSSAAAVRHEPGRGLIQGHGLWAVATPSPNDEVPATCRAQSGGTLGLTRASSIKASPAAGHGQDNGCSPRRCSSPT
jgi:hypothetical protein